MGVTIGVDVSVGMAVGCGVNVAVGMAVGVGAGVQPANRVMTSTKANRHGWVFMGFPF